MTKCISVSLAMLALTSVACETRDAIAPVEDATLHTRSAQLIGEPAPYSGQLTPGVFVLCTSRIAPAGTYHYLIDAPSKSMKALKELDMSPGECRVVAEIKKNFMDVPAGTVTITPVSSLQLDGLVVIDAICSDACETFPAPTSAILSGTSGAIAKYYYVQQGILTSGGHGGTGTLHFDAD